MADQFDNNARSPNPDAEIDDPLAELARIIGYERPSGDTATTDGASQSSEFDLEAELMRELDVPLAPSIDELDRAPKCVVLRFEPDGISVEARPLDVKPSKEIFNLEKRIQVEAREATMTQFVDKLNTMVKDRREGDFEDSIEVLKEQDEGAVTAEVADRARTYIENARADLAGTV